MVNTKRPGEHLRNNSDRVTDSRFVAFQVLLAVAESEAYANLLLPHRVSEAQLDAQDAALATELTYGSLRWQGLYDHIIALTASRPIESIDLRALVVMRLGIHQLLAMRTGAHAAVDQSVRLARKRCGESVSRFVNAVLRRVSEKTREEWLEELRKTVDNDLEWLAISTSHPLWIVRAFRDSLHRAYDSGRSEEDLIDLLDIDNVGPKVTLSKLAERESFSTESKLDPCEYSPVGFRMMHGGNPAQLSLVSRGLARVQDEGSQLAALTLVNARPMHPHEKWLDMCAGPGGKAAILASHAARAGAEFTAIELHEARADLVRNAISAFGEFSVLCGDATSVGAVHPHEFDRILLDAPCTGLGSLRRRPESRWRKSIKDVSELCALQEKLLVSAIAALKPGGHLVYVTCSPHLAETRGIIDAALRKHPHIRECDVRSVLDSFTAHPLPDTGKGPSVQLWPHRHGTDAMFISLLTKVE